MTSPFIPFWPGVVALIAFDLPNSKCFTYQTGVNEFIHASTFYMNVIFLGISTSEEK
jgi:hypothetical protein